MVNLSLSRRIAAALPLVIDIACATVPVNNPSHLPTPTSVPNTLPSIPPSEYAATWTPSVHETLEAYFGIGCTEYDGKYNVVRKMAIWRAERVIAHHLKPEERQNLEASIVIDTHANPDNTYCVQVYQRKYQRHAER